MDSHPAGSVRAPALAAVLLGLVALLPSAVAGQAGAPTPQIQTRRVTVTWESAPIHDVLRAFAAYSGKSIVAASGVAGVVTADIDDQPWDVALQAILSVNGLVATEDAYGIVRVDSMADLDAREAVEPVLTRSYRISYSRAAELQAALAPLLTERGSVSVVESTNTLIVSDIARVQRAIGALLR